MVELQRRWHEAQVAWQKPHKGEAARASTSRWQLLSHLHIESEALPQAYHLEMPLFFAACLILFASIPKMNLMFYKDLFVPRVA